VKLKVFVVRDSATNFYGTPMFLVANGQAVRSFTDEVNRQDKDNQLYLHPDDFELYVLGEWDSETAGFECDVPQLLARGKDVSTKSIEVN